MFMVVVVVAAVNIDVVVVELRLLKEIFLNSLIFNRGDWWRLLSKVTHCHNNYKVETSVLGYSSFVRSLIRSLPRQWENKQ